MRILLVGGGTAGHLFPLVAIAKELQKQENIFIHFVIAKNNSDKYIIENTAYSYTEFSVAKLRRYFSWENFRDFFVFGKNIFSAFFFLKKWKPDKIFSKGGFVSLPIGIAAKILRIPFYLHETDKIMGLSNKILSRFADKIFTGFPSRNPKYIFVGNPVREEFFKASPCEGGLRRLEKSKNTPPSPPSQGGIKILIFGGSQGAQALNQWARKFFANRDEEVFLIAGKGKTKKLSKITEVEFLLENFAQKVHEADVIITRAGGSISELAAAKKMVILIPLPSSANDHQRANAKFFADQNAAIYREEENLYSSETKQILEKIFSSPSERKIFEQNISKFAYRDTVEKICEEVLKK